MGIADSPARGPVMQSAADYARVQPALVGERGGISSSSAAAAAVDPSHVMHGATPGLAGVSSQQVYMGSHPVNEADWR